MKLRLSVQSLLPWTKELSETVLCAELLWNNLIVIIKSRTWRISHQHREATTYLSYSKILFDPSWISVTVPLLNQRTRQETVLLWKSAPFLATSWHKKTCSHKTGTLHVYKRDQWAVIVLSILRRVISWPTSAAAAFPMTASNRFLMLFLC